MIIDKERILDLEHRLAEAQAKIASQTLELAESIEVTKQFCKNLEAKTQEAVRYDKEMMLARLENIGQVASIAIAYVVKPSDKSYKRLQEAVKVYLKANPDIVAEMDKRFSKKADVNIC